MNKIVILAAGKGTRMGGDIPKVLVPLNGRPMITYLLDSIISSGIDSSPIVVSSPDIIEETQKALADYSVTYAIQEKQLGTGDALAAACNHFPVGATSIITFYGDHPLIRPTTMVDLMRLHEHMPSPVTIMTVEARDFNEWPNFLHWGRIVRDEKNNITRIVEYKDATEQERSITEVNPAIYCFDRTWLCENIKQLSNNNAQGEYYLTDLIDRAFSQGHLINGTQMTPQEAIGVNTPDELSIAEKMVS